MKSNIRLSKITLRQAALLPLGLLNTGSLLRNFDFSRNGSNHSPTDDKFRNVLLTLFRRD